MPSRTRGRATKSSKENIGVVKTKPKTSAKVLKGTRKPLSDKTNSASDDNASLCDKSKNPVASVPDTQLKNVCVDNVKRPRRDRRLPTRFKENETLTNLSNSFITSPSKQESPAFKTPSPVQKKNNVVNNTQATKNPTKKSTVLAKKVQLSPAKSPVKSLDCSIVKSRPKRICRLPSKLEDHSISPNKYIPLQPINASTPFATKNKKVIKNNAANVIAILDITPEKLPNLTTKNTNEENIETLSTIQNSSPEKHPKQAKKAKKVYGENTDNSINTSPILPKKRVTRQKAVSNGIKQKAVADNNNNAKKNKKVQESPSKSPGTPGKIFRTRERNLRKNTSLRLLDDNKNHLKRDSSKLDVYEFTFDPNEEPPPAKKKKKKAAPRKPRPKTVTIKSNYDRILAAALANLKKTVAAKSSNTENNIKKKGETTTIIKENMNTESINHNEGVTITIKENANNINNQNIIHDGAVATTIKDSINTKNTKHNGEVSMTSKQNANSDDNNHIYASANDEHSNLVKEKSIANEKNYHSVRVEDIARDFQINEDDHAIDYSPVNSPSRPITPTDHVQCNVQVQTPNSIDPLGLREDSFFDEIPVASSSMNVSVRHPQASPWRVEFGNLPIKWQVNTYVKPNMTPAFESSFINFNDTKKKHVYTNIVPEAHDPIPHVDDTSNLKQTSIISFIKEVVERNANKKNKKSTPVKTNSLFEDLPSTSAVHHKTPSKETPHKNNTNSNITPEAGKQYENSSSDMSVDKENPSMLNKENSTENVTPKDVNKNVNKNSTYFGFDDIEDQENVSPIKKNDRAKSLRSHTRGILQEINEHKGPTRAMMPVAAKSKPAQNKLNKNEMKSATEPPVFPEVAVDGCTDTTNAQESCVSENLDTEDQSVHLFEDIDLLFIHHPKPSRKSYGKTKKVTFIQKPVVGSDDSSMSDQEVEANNAAVSSDEEDLNDLSFKLPLERPKKTIKKKKPKKQLSKKEEKEVEAWAAGFNSMCEDIDGFDLVVE